MAAEMPVDIFVIGGGVNGCGVARDAAGRGYSVQLAEMNDLGSGTSSLSTKLIHGGLRYLEHYEFRLVREALREREILWAAAPHIIWPLRLILPYHRGMRPAWLLRLGLFLYDHMGGRRDLPASKALDLRSDPAGEALKPECRRAFEFSDCWVDDARLVVLNARDAADRGAEITTRSKVVSAQRDGKLWELEIEDAANGETRSVAARLLVNAAGPWVEEVLRDAVGSISASNVRLVRGSHIVIRRKFDDERAFFFQNGDGRIFFAIPYEGAYTLVGTTDCDHEVEPGQAEISTAEIDYLCESASGYFREPVRRDDIVWSYSGIRPLYDDGASKAEEATRDYVLKTDAPDGEAPLVNIFGGKITTYRRLAESVLEEVGGLIGARGKSWTAKAHLPGGNFGKAEFLLQVQSLKRTFPFLGAEHARRLCRLYGTLANQLLGTAKGYSDLGRHFGADLYESEVRHLVDTEWARSSEDILWRRTKLGLRMAPEEVANLAQYLEARLGGHQSHAAE